MASQRTRWNNEEKAKLVERARELMASGISRPLEAIRKAQNVLPRDRRRTILHMGQVPWFKNGARGAGRESSRDTKPMANGAGGHSAGAASHRDALVDAVADFFREVFMRVGQAGPSSSRAGARKRGRPPSKRKSSRRG